MKILNLSFTTTAISEELNSRVRDEYYRSRTKIVTIPVLQSIQYEQNRYEDYQASEESRMNSYITFSRDETIISYGNTVVERLDYVLFDKCLLPESVNTADDSDQYPHIHIQSNDTCWHILDLDQWKLSFSVIRDGTIEEYIK